MKRVTSIVLDGKSVHSAWVNPLGLMQECDVCVDNCAPVPYTHVGENVVGVGYSDDGAICMVVYDNLSLRLLDYVESIGLVYADSIECDAYISTDDSIRRMKSGGRLYIHTVSDKISMCDAYGTVFYRRALYRTQAEVLSLYDLLVLSCKMCKCNVMNFSTITYSPHGGRVCLFIKLMETPEAKVFFTKMYLGAL